VSLAVGRELMEEAQARIADAVQVTLGSASPEPGQTLARRESRGGRIPLAAGGDVALGARAGR
jgi:hypothetical protein